ncbi:MAG: hypothetical protein A2017_00910 [Lentisphaerae bacterium GWF2_44_16]|nr:MAG: hypothetical protein A2017_00910 [Lentisphaerae bacterium GWF2_44_16]
MISPIYRPFFELTKLVRAFADAIFYTNIVLLVFSYMNRKLFKKEAPLRLFMVVFVFNIILQFIVFFSAPYEKRYLCFFTFMVVILSVPGVPKLAELIQKLSKYIPWLTPKISFTAVMLIIIGISAGKALTPSGNPKRWFKDIPVEIKKHCPPGQMPVLITDSSDERSAYYAKADYIKLSLGDENIRYKKVNGVISEIFPLANRYSIGFLVKRGVNDSYGAWVLMDIPHGFEYFSDNIQNLGGDKVFVLVTMSHKDFSVYFEEKSIPFPSIKFIKEFKYKHGKMIFTLYQGIPPVAKK